MNWCGGVGRQGFAVLLIALGLWSGAISAQDRIDLSPAEAVAVAREALSRGDLDLAEGIARALIERNPEDAGALLLLAIIAQERGQSDAALNAARRAYRIDAPDRLRFEAAMIAAQAHFASTRYGSARWWLRHAMDVAPGPQEAKIAEQNFAHARRVDPLSVTLRFAANPSSNVNNGAEVEAITIGGLPFTLSADARELSGYEVSAGIDLAYTLSESSDHKLTALAGAFGQAVWLTPEAAAAAPDVDGSDFNYVNLSLGLRYEKLAFDGFGATGGGLTLGRTWYGNMPYSNVLGASLFQDLKAPEGHGTRLRARFEHEVILEDATENNTTFEIGTILRRPLGDMGVVDLNAALGHTGSQSISVDHRFATLGARFFLADPIGPARVSLHLGGKARDFDASPYAAGGRHDRELSAGVSLAFPDASYMGFQPTFDLSARKVFSSVDLFDRGEVSASLGVASRF